MKRINAEGGQRAHDLDGVYSAQVEGADHVNEIVGRAQWIDGEIEMVDCPALLDQIAGERQGRSGGIHDGTGSLRDIARDGAGAGDGFRRREGVTAAHLGDVENARADRDDLRTVLIEPFGPRARTPLVTVVVPV